MVSHSEHSAKDGGMKTSFCEQLMLRLDDIDLLNKPETYNVLGMCLRNLVDELSRGHPDEPYWQYL